jgi:hypothetical protein
LNLTHFPVDANLDDNESEQSESEEEEEEKDEEQSEVQEFIDKRKKA